MVSERRCPTGTTRLTENTDLVVRSIEGGRITLGAHSESHEESTDPSAQTGPDTIRDFEVVIDEHDRHVGPPPEPGLTVTGGVVPDHDVRIGDSWSVHADFPAIGVGSIGTPAWSADTEYTFVGIEPGNGVEVAVMHSRSRGGPAGHVTESQGDVRVALGDAMIRFHRSRDDSDGCVSTIEESTVRD